MTNPTGDALKASAAQVRVKPLEWNRDDDMASVQISVAYYLERRPGYCALVTMPTGERIRREPFPSVEAAKEAGQADYEARILSALSVEQAPQPVAIVTNLGPEAALTYRGSDPVMNFLRRFEGAKALGNKYTRMTLDEAESLAAFLRAAPTEAPPVESQAAGWQPITTAPISNGSNSFLAYITGHGPHVCYAGAGRYIYSVSTGKRIHRATHWMTFPPPPALAAEGSAE